MSKPVSIMYSVQSAQYRILPSKQTTEIPVICIGLLPALELAETSTSMVSPEHHYDSISNSLRGSILGSLIKGG